MKTIPLFKSHYSKGKSILTLAAYSDSPPDVVEPDSAVQIAKDEGLEKLTLVDDTMGGFMEAYSNCEDAGLELDFGVRLSFFERLSSGQKSDDKEVADNTEHKNIIFARNTAGYKKLIKIYTEASTVHFDKFPRLDYSTLQRFWSDDLLLAIPFYDSYIYRNHLTLGNCFPDFDEMGIEPFVLLEDNGLPFDGLLREKAKAHAEGCGYPTQEVKTIYYKDRADFRAWMTFKLIGRRGYYGKPPSLGAPNLDHCCSDSFCIEAWREGEAAA